MDRETHRPREEPENSRIAEQFPADPAHERRGVVGEDEVPEPDGAAPGAAGPVRRAARRSEDAGRHRHRLRGPGAEARWRR